MPYVLGCVYGTQSWHPKIRSKVIFRRALLIGGMTAAMMAPAMATAFADEGEHGNKHEVAQETDDQSTIQGPTCSAACYSNDDNEREGNYIPGACWHGCVTPPVVTPCVCPAPVPPPPPVVCPKPKPKPPCVTPRPKPPIHHRHHYRHHRLHKVCKVIYVWR